MESRKKQYDAVDEQFLNHLFTYASIVSHELKNPLASLKNVAYFLDKAIITDDPTTNKMIKTLNAEVDRTNDRIKNLLDHPRVKTLNRKMMDLAEAVKAVIEQHKGNSEIIETDILAAKCFADKMAVEKVIENILTNALESIKENGKISVKVYSKDSAAECIISDNGAGMDADTLLNAVKPMFSTKQKQLGLGLTVAEYIIYLHNGTLDITSQKGKGAAVKIRIPEKEILK